MSVMVRCGHCGRSLKVKDKYAGKRCLCPGCGASLDVPALPSAAFELPAAESPSGGPTSGIEPALAGGPLDDPPTAAADEESDTRFLEGFEDELLATPPTVAGSPRPAHQPGQKSPPPGRPSPAAPEAAPESFTVHCPHCGLSLAATAALVGQGAKCARCRRSFVVVRETAAPPAEGRPTPAPLSGDKAEGIGSGSSPAPAHPQPAPGQSAPSRRARLESLPAGAADRGRNQPGGASPRAAPSRPPATGPGGPNIFDELPDLEALSHAADGGAVALRPRRRNRPNRFASGAWKVWLALGGGGGLLVVAAIAAFVQPLVFVQTLLTLLALFAMGCYLTAIVKMFAHGRAGLALVSILTWPLCGLGYFVALASAFNNREQWKLGAVPVVWGLSLVLQVVLLGIVFAVGVGDEFRASRSARLADQAASPPAAGGRPDLSEFAADPRSPTRGGPGGGPETGAQSAPAPMLVLSRAVFVRVSRGGLDERRIAGPLRPQQFSDLQLSVDYRVEGPPPPGHYALSVATPKARGQFDGFHLEQEGTIQCEFTAFDADDAGPYRMWIEYSPRLPLRQHSGARVSNEVVAAQASQLPTPKLSLPPGGREAVDAAELSLPGVEAARAAALSSSAPAELVDQLLARYATGLELAGQIVDLPTAQDRAAAWNELCREVFRLPLAELAQAMTSDAFAPADREAIARRAEALQAAVDRLRGAARPWSGQPALLAALRSGLAQSFTLGQPETISPLAPLLLGDAVRIARLSVAPPERPPGAVPRPSDRAELRDADLLTKAVADLASIEAAHRRAAAERLAEAPPDDARQGDVIAALDPLWDDPNPFARQAVRKAWVRWAGSAEAARLAEVAGGRDHALRGEAIAALARIRHSAAIEALVGLLGEFATRREVQQALIDCGPDAERSVQAALANPKADVRRAACEILAEIGTRASLKPLEQLARDVRSREAARAAWEAIQSRSAKRPGGGAP